MIQKAFFVGGTGSIAGGVARQMIQLRDNDPKLHANPTRIVGLASRKAGYIYDEAGIPNDKVIAFTEGQILGTRFHKASDLINLVREPTVFLDLTAGAEEMLDFHNRVIFETEHSIVTANKIPLTICSYDKFRRLTRDYERYRFSCSVMAGAGAVNWLRNRYDLEDEVVSIEGCFSGTLGYITTELAKGKRFSDIVREAKALGYTEPHPRDDLSGKDVGRKAVILARIAGIEVPGITLIGLVNDDYLREDDPEKFLARLVELDPVFHDMIADPANAGMRLKYVATVKARNGEDAPSIVVKPMFLPSNSKLGSLEGTENKVVIKTRIYRNGWSIDGPGAGVDVTASNVRDDLMGQLRGRKAKMENLT